MLLGTVQAVSFSADPAHGRFPPPRTVEEQAGCFVVRYHNGQQLAYVYYESEPGRQSAAKPLTKDEGGGLYASRISLAMFNCGQHKLCFNPKIAEPRWSEPMLPELLKGRTKP